VQKSAILLIFHHFWSFFAVV